MHDLETRDGKKHLTETTPEELWNSDKLKEPRDSLNKGEYSSQIAKDVGKKKAVVLKVCVLCTIKSHGLDKK